MDEPSAQLAEVRQRALDRGTHRLLRVPQELRLRNAQREVIVPDVPGERRPERLADEDGDAARGDGIGETAALVGVWMVGVWRVGVWRVGVWMVGVVNMVGWTGWWA